MEVASQRVSMGQGEFSVGSLTVIHPFNRFLNFRLIFKCWKYEMVVLAKSMKLQFYSLFQYHIMGCLKGLVRTCKSKSNTENVVSTMYTLI